MQLYQYVAVNSAQKKVEGIYRAASEEEVLDFLESKGLVPISVAPYRKKKAAKKKRRLHTKITLDDYLFFARQMSVMLDAGVPLLRVLDVIRDETSSIKLRNCVSSLRDLVSSGWSLERAMSKHPDVFDKLWVNIVRTGETTGQLGFVLKRLGDHLERQSSFMKKIQSAMVYPAILLIMTIAAVIFLSVFIIPKFEKLFEGFGQEIPGLTKTVLGFSKFLQAHFILIIISVIVFAILFRIFINTAIGKAIWDIFVLKVPLLKNFSKMVMMESISANLAILAESGVPILTALEITADSMKNQIAAGYLNMVKERVREGIPLAMAMEPMDFFDSILVQMISVGEEVGDLSQMLNKIARYYEEEMDTMLIKFTSMFEPIMLVVMAGVIGVLVASIFLPIFKIATLGAR